jgi:hypothetical protein
MRNWFPTVRIARVLAVCTVASIGLMLGAQTLPAGASPIDRAKLAGTWRCDTITLVDLRGLQLGKPFFQTATRPGDGRRVVEVAGDVVTARTTFLPGLVDTDVYQMDNLPHELEWGDTVPRETKTRTAHWTPDGFEALDVIFGTQRVERWTLVHDRHLRIEQTSNHPCPPCAPGRVRTAWELSR